MTHRPFALSLLSLASLSILAGCGEGSPTMRPGENCLTCHDGAQASKLTLAGTVYPAVDSSLDAGLAGVKVIITDGNLVEKTLTTNAAGNFYTTEIFVTPITVQVERGGVRAQMGTPLTTATVGCASCHDDPPSSGAPGRIHAP